MNKEIRRRQSFFFKKWDVISGIGSKNERFFFHHIEKEVQLIALFA